MSHEGQMRQRLPFCLVPTIPSESSGAFWVLSWYLEAVPGMETCGGFHIQRLASISAINGITNHANICVNDKYSSPESKLGVGG